MTFCLPCLVNLQQPPVPFTFPLYCLTLCIIHGSSPLPCTCHVSSQISLPFPWDLDSAAHYLYFGFNALLLPYAQPLPTWTRTCLALYDLHPHPTFTTTTDNFVPCTTGSFAFPLPLYITTPPPCLITTTTPCLVYLWDLYLQQHVCGSSLTLHCGYLYYCNLTYCTWRLHTYHHTRINIPLMYSPHNCNIYHHVDTFVVVITCLCCSVVGTSCCGQHYNSPL